MSRVTLLVSRAVSIPMPTWAAIQLVGRTRSACRVGSRGCCRRQTFQEGLGRRQVRVSVRERFLGLNNHLVRVRNVNMYPTRKTEECQAQKSPIGRLNFQALTPGSTMIYKVIRSRQSKLTLLSSLSRLHLRRLPHRRPRSPRQYPNQYRLLPWDF